VLRAARAVPGMAVMKAPATAATRAAAIPMTAAGDHSRMPAPAAAPASMAATEPSRRCGLAPGPPASALSAVSPVRVSVSTVVVRSGAPRWRTVLFCTPRAAARTAIVANLPSPVKGSTLVPVSTATRPRMSASR
jgi:hypothetical protein